MIHLHSAALQVSTCHTSLSARIIHTHICGLRIAHYLMNGELGTHNNNNNNNFAIFQLSIAARYVDLCARNYSNRMNGH